LKQGVIDKNSIGAERSESLFHRIVKDYGSTVGKEFLNSIARLLDRYMTLRGFTYAFDELAISDEVRQKIKKATEKAEERVNVLIESYRKENLDRLAGQTIEESLEIYIMNELSTVRDLAGQYSDSYFPEDNQGIIMARAGARGSMLNIGQMTASLGQQSIRGKRILRGYRDRTLPFFKPNDAGAEARGFVYASYRDGLNPTEFFFHAVGGREGLVDTAVRTQQSGYMQRRLINALEHIRVEYDGTVRDSTGNIIQFSYGEDGVDTTKSDHGKAVNIERLVDSVRLFSAKGAIAGKRYIESKIDSISNKLPPSLVDELRRNLQGAKLTRKSVDQAISLTMDSYVRALIEPGEAAGIVSAQSIGEPGTQMTLRTFHFAGVKEQNVTLGLPRLIEIVDARKIPSTPTMTIYLEKKYRNREKAEQVANAVTHTILEDIADSIVSDIAKMKVMVKLNPNTMKDRGITLQEVREALKPPNSKVNIDRYDVEVTPKEMEIPQFKRFMARLRVFKLKGAPSVRKALVLEDQGEWIIRTEGSGLDVALNQPGVDKTRTISNNVHEVAEVLGIEAARNVLIKEAMAVLDEQGLDVDIRHVMLVADMMTNSGVVLQVGRHGISGEKSSTLAKAAFEITIPTIVDAAVKGTKDMLRGVAENVIVGRQVPMGTGLIDVYMSMPEKEKK
jgi:DNA-directed RNA polymerase subunit A'